MPQYQTKLERLALIYIISFITFPPFLECLFLVVLFVNKQSSTDLSLYTPILLSPPLQTSFLQILQPLSHTYVQSFSAFQHLFLTHYYGLLYIGSVTK